MQLSALPWLGFVPDDVSAAPPAAVGRLARRLGLAVADLAGYGEREQTRSDHLREIAEYLGWKPAKTIELKELDEFLLARAMEHDAPSLLGPHGMAASCGIPYDVLAWAAEWYIWEETLREANICLVNYHHKLPMTAMFGSGTLSSSDGQRFPTRGKSITARHLNKYFVAEGISTYTHVSDQHSTFGTKVIVATHREAHYVLDEILGNATDLPITEHATDTHGVTLVNFGLFDLVGKQLSPRIRDLGKITLYRMGAKGDCEERFPKAGPLLTKKANLDLIADHWDDLLRLAGSLKYGHATASLIVKLSASSRQNVLAAALKEFGAIRRTIYVAKYLSDEGYRRKIARQLNKGESLHALRRQLHYAREGKVTRRQPEQQNEQAWCLTVVTNAVVCWHREYMGRAVGELRGAGRDVDAEVLAHISPARSSVVNYYGSITVDYEHELAQLDDQGHRPLRTVAMDDPGAGLLAAGDKRR